MQPVTIVMVTDMDRSLDRRRRPFPSAPVHDSSPSRSEPSFGGGSMIIAHPDRLVIEDDQHLRPGTAGG
ncbi:MAG: hypothetical protein ACR2JP_11235 [Acidimicrobiia bacterium]